MIQQKTASTTAVSRRRVAKGAAALAALATLVLGSASAASAATHQPEGSGPVSLSARGTVVSIYNGTSGYIYRNYSSLSHGVWNDATPPQQIATSTTASFGSHSSGFMTGTQGEVQYQLTQGEATITWDNPYSGSNSYSCSVPAGYTCAWTGGSGNNASVTFTLGGGPAANSVVKSDLVSRSAARSTYVKLQNRTPSEMDRTSSSLSHGTWSENMLPPDAIYPMNDGVWESQSNGFMTGTQGTAVFNMAAVGNVVISWDNPYSGSNSYGCTVPSGYTCSRAGGSGDSANVTFTVAQG